MVSGFFSAFLFHSLSLFCFQTNICNSSILIRLTSLLAFSFLCFILVYGANTRTHVSLSWVNVLISQSGLVASNVPLYTTVVTLFPTHRGSVPQGDVCHAPSLGISYHIPCIECTCCTTVAFVFHAQKLYCDPLQFPPAPLPHGGCFSWVDASRPHALIIIFQSWVTSFVIWQVQKLFCIKKLYVMFDCIYRYPRSK